MRLYIAIILFAIFAFSSAKSLFQGKRNTNVRPETVQEELEEKAKHLREGCYPRPRGCLCEIGEDSDGNPQTERLYTDEECTTNAYEEGMHGSTEDEEEEDRKARKFVKRNPQDEEVENEEEDGEESHEIGKRDRNSQDPDPVREKAQANYNKVVEELNDRFRNYKENCYPRPKGCLCVIGTDSNGQDITKRIHDDRECKNPASGA